MGQCCSWFLWFAGITCFIVGVVFDWINFEGLRRNDIEIASTGNKACDFALDEYHWIFMASVICKMIFGLLEYCFGYKSFGKGKEKKNNVLPFKFNTNGEERNKFDTLSLLFSVITSSFQIADLLLLVLFSYKCLDKGKRHHVLRFLGDDKDDVFASVFGTAGIIFNLTIKRNILTILQSLCSCSKEDHGWLKVLSFISLVLICVCIGLAIALIIKLDF